MPPQAPQSPLSMVVAAWPIMVPGIVFAFSIGVWVATLQGQVRAIGDGLQQAVSAGIKEREALTTRYDGADREHTREIAALREAKVASETRETATQQRLNSIDANIAQILGELRQQRQRSDAPSQHSDL